MVVACWALAKAFLAAWISTGKWSLTTVSDEMCHEQLTMAKMTSTFRANVLRNFFTFLPSACSMLYSCMSSTSPITAARGSAMTLTAKFNHNRNFCGFILHLACIRRYIHLVFVNGILATALLWYHFCISCKLQHNQAHSPNTCNIYTPCPFGKVSGKTTVPPFFWTRCSIIQTDNIHVHILYNQSYQTKSINNIKLCYCTGTAQHATLVNSCYVSWGMGVRQASKFKWFTWSDHTTFTMFCHLWTMPNKFEVSVSTLHPLQRYEKGFKM